MGFIKKNAFSAPPLLWRLRSHNVGKLSKVLFFRKMLLLVSCLSGEVSADSKDSCVVVRVNCHGSPESRSERGWLTLTGEADTDITAGSLRAPQPCWDTSPILSMKVKL